MNLTELIIDWSEVWALLIPLSVILIYGAFTKMELIVLYVFIALILNGFSTISYFFNQDMPSFLKNNNIFYNLHSITRVVLLGFYIYQARPKKTNSLLRLVASAYFAFVVINFIFIKSPFYFSTWLFAAESIMLLFLCIQYFLKTIQDDSKTNWTRQPSFIICAGVLIYEAITFFIFLFIIPMAENNPAFGLLCLKIYKITYVLLCGLIAFALLKAAVNTPAKSR